MTPTEVHFLVGLLVLVFSEENVEIKLGDLIRDEAADEARDVDITVLVIGDRPRTFAFRGLEVKHHKRPLDVTHVEQLAQKLRDMPSITDRYVVSSSGYTGGAIKKAEAHGVELLELTKWDNPMEGFDHVKFSDDFHVLESLVKWKGSPSLRLEVPPALRGTPLERFSSAQFSVLQTSGKWVPATPEEISRGLLSDFLNKFRQTESGRAAKNGEVFPLVGSVALEPPIRMDFDSARHEIHTATLTAEVECVERRTQPEMMILRKVGESRPFVGCAIWETAFETLSGVTVDANSRALKFINIPATVRQFRALRGYRLGHRTEGP